MTSCAMPQALGLDNGMRNDGSGSGEAVLPNDHRPIEPGHTIGPLARSQHRRHTLGQRGGCPGLSQCHPIRCVPATPRNGTPNREPAGLIFPGFRAKNTAFDENLNPGYPSDALPGEVAEWLNAPVSKTATEFFQPIPSTPLTSCIARPVSPSVTLHAGI
jgi:hypothetical protein